MELPTPTPLLRPRLLAAGMTDDELRRARRRGELVVVAPGVYADPTDPMLRRPERRHRLRVTAALPRAAPDAVVSHVSAAVLHGLPIWDQPLDVVHMTRARRTSGGRTGRLHVHTTPLEPDEIVEVDGIRVTSVPRTLADVARTAGFEQAVVVVDAALHKHLVDRAALAAAVARASGWPGAPDARRVAAFANAGAQSVGESRSRVAMARHGVAPPTLQWPVVGGGRVLGTADFGWPEHGWAGEFDGMVKYGRLLRPGETPPDAVVREKRREDAMRTRLHGFSRWIWDEIDDFAEVARRLPH